MDIGFRDNAIASWCRNGKIIDTLSPQDEFEDVVADNGWNDMTNLAEVFSRVRVVAGGFVKARRIVRDASEEAIWILSDITKMMRGIIPVPEYYHNDLTEPDLTRECRLITQSQEMALQAIGARIAIGKLMAMTSSGKKKLSPTEWTRFIDTWAPRFDVLELFDDSYPGRAFFCWR